jgi:RecB family exonuclease
MEVTELGPVKQWSFSRLSSFEQCPYKIYLSSVEKLKGPERDENHPAERGTKIHTNCEDYVNGKSDVMVKEMDGFKEDFEILREDFKEGKVELEGDWGFDIDWQQTGWFDKNVWARIKLDALRLIDSSTARVIDYKTGKKFGNEVKHTQQAQLYMVGAFMRIPELQMIETEFWYLDQNTKMTKIYTRDKLALYLRKFTERAMRLTSCTEFKPKPSKMNCRWCDWGVENGTGACPFAVPNI